MKKTKMHFVTAIAALSTMLLASCGTSSTPTSVSNTSASPAKSQASSNATVRKGMTREQVVQIMGQPHRKNTYNERETWTYVGGNNAEMVARGFAGNFIPVVGPLVAFAGAEAKSSTTSVTFIGSQVSNVDSMSTSAPVVRGAFAGF